MPSAKVRAECLESLGPSYLMSQVGSVMVSVPQKFSLRGCGSFRLLDGHVDLGSMGFIAWLWDLESK